MCISHYCRFALRAYALLVSALLVAATGMVARAASYDDLTVPTRYGPVRGTRVAGVRVFKGIPYAAPPVGNLRWRPPTAPHPWHEPLPCIAFKPACPQVKDKRLPSPTQMDEDCLYLNVFTPAHAGEKLPVMVWIHGGGFTRGAASLPAYDSPALARHGVVLVTVNYRLGVFGFLAHPALTAESRHHASGNYGLMDQIFALQWVKDNITGFGGDPGCVTIFGESAGAVSVAVLMASPLVRGLFQRAIMESGSVPGSLHSRQRLEQAGVALQRRLGIPDGPNCLRQMRAKSWREIMAADQPAGNLPGAGVTKWVSLDGYVLTESPAQVFAAGRQARVPFMAGSTADEGSLFASKMPVKTVRRYQALLRLACGNLAPRALQLYPAATNEQVKPALTAFLTDIFVAGARHAVRAMAAVEPNVYLYHFTRTNEISRRTGLGCFHGSELVYVFHTFPAWMQAPAGDEQLSQLMMGYWTRFARTGNPNGDGASPWPRYRPDTDEDLVLNIPPTVGSHLHAAGCDFWDQFRSRR